VTFRPFCSSRIVEMTATDAEAPPLGAQELVQAMLVAEIEADWDAWGALVAADVLMDHSTGGPTVGIAENLSLLKRFREAVDDYQRDVFDLVCDATSAAFRFAITGVLARDVGDMVATDEPFEIAGAAFVTTWGGRVVRIVEILTTNTLRSG
jgi:ketosteroid isomerase-like protein